jgi:hypothetical protein
MGLPSLLRAGFRSFCSQLLLAAGGEPPNPFAYFDA